MEHLAEALQDLDEALVLAPGEIGVDDIVIQEIGAGTGSHGEKLVARTVDEHGAKRAYFGGYVNWHLSEDTRPNGDYEGSPYVKPQRKTTCQALTALQPSATSFTTSRPIRREITTTENIV